MRIKKIFKLNLKNEINEKQIKKQVRTKNKMNNSTFYC